MTDENEISQLRLLNRDLQQKIAELEADLQGRETLWKYKEIFNATFDAIFIQDVLTGQILDVNDTMLRLYGFASKEAALANTISEMSTNIPPYTETEAMQKIRLAAGGQPQVFEWLAKKCSGEIFWAEVSLRKSLIDGENRILAVVRDITARKQAENALYESKELLSAIFNAIPVRIFWKDKDLTYLGCNTVFAQDAGFAHPRDVIGKNDYDLAWREQAEQYRADDRAVIESGKAKLSFDEPQTTPSGKQIHLLTSKVPLRDAAGNIVGVLGTYEDITERRQIEEDLANTQIMLESAFEQTPIPMVLVSMPDRVLRIANTACRELLDIADEPVSVGQALRNFAPSYVEYDANGDLIPLTKAPLVQAMQGQNVYNEARKIVTQNGKERWVLASASPIYNTHGELIAAYLVFPDITEQKQAEKALRESEEQLRTLINSMPDIICFKDGQGRWLEANEFDINLFNLQGVAYRGKKDSELAPFSEFYHDAFLGCEATDEIAWQKGTLSRCDEIIPTPDGPPKVFDIIKVPTFYPDGARKGLVVVGRDITERKRAEAEQEKLQAQLLQAQKMESVGRLAGGVAHDFNNMLLVILGHSELALKQLPPNHPLHSDLEEIHQAARRSADLTHQLLAFARKQTITPQVLDLNNTLAGILKMLKRLIGEDIDLLWVPGDDLWLVKMDPTQIDQILANLAVNARDAIVGVGRLTISTENVTLDRAYCATSPDLVPGDYVLLTVSDNGAGMSHETLKHLFEPFFTTKKPGEGTGLGLATIYGIVKQNNGLINVYSEPGLGTTFKIYLPRLIDEKAGKPNELQTEAIAGGTETILLVEDEPAILEMTQLILEDFGYLVLAANSPTRAMELAQQHAGKIHLLITDVVMPVMNGRDVAEQLYSLYPAMKCLFMSGYTSDVIAHRGILDEGVSFIQKPFSIKELATKIRQALDTTDITLTG